MSGGDSAGIVIVLLVVVGLFFVYREYRKMSFASKQQRFMKDIQKQPTLEDGTLQDRLNKRQEKMAKIIEEIQEDRLRDAKRQEEIEQLMRENNADQKLMKRKK